MTDPALAIAAVAPHANAAAWAKALSPAMQSAGITTPNRIAAFIGQIAVESAYFERTEEDLWYTSAAHIAETFSRSFAGAAEAVPFIGDPEALANRVYAGENGNGQPGDGYRFRGRGLIQVTGRANYTAFAKSVGRMLDDLFLAWVTEPAGAAASACWFWNMRGINALADGWQITEVTRRINPALDGLGVREMTCGAARAALLGPERPHRTVSTKSENAPVMSTTPPPDPSDAQNVVPDEADRLDAEFNPKE